MITYQNEKVADVLLELRSILPIQHAETGDKDLPCEPAWVVYQNMEKVGFVLLTMRDEGRLIGYATCVAHRHINSQNVLVGGISTYWVEERAGRALLLRALLQHATLLLWGKGVAQIMIDTEPEHSAGRLLEAMGAQQAKIGYVIKRADAQEEARHA